MILFLSFISCLKCYPAESLHLFKLMWGKRSSWKSPVCTILSVLLPKTQWVTEFHSQSLASRHSWDLRTALRDPEAWRPGLVTAKSPPVMSQSKISHHSVTQLLCRLDQTVLRLHSAWAKLFITFQETITCLIFTYCPNISLLSCIMYLWLILLKCVRWSNVNASVF